MSADVFARVAFPRLRDADLERERARERRRGYADGHAEGFRAGAQAATAAAATAAAAEAERAAAHARTVATAMAALEAAAASLTARAEALTAASDARVFDAAVELAAAIVGAELADDERSARAAVRRALAAADPAELQAVRLNPADLAVLERLGTHPDGVVLIADDTLERGDAVAALTDGHIDARVGAALARARRALAEETP